MDFNKVHLHEMTLNQVFTKKKKVRYFSNRPCILPISYCVPDLMTVVYFWEIFSTFRWGKSPAPFSSSPPQCRRVPEGPLLKMLHTDGGESSSRFLKSRPQSWSLENKIIHKTSRESVSQFISSTWCTHKLRPPSELRMGKCTTLSQYLPSVILSCEILHELAFNCTSCFSKERFQFLLQSHFTWFHSLIGRNTNLSIVKRALGYWKLKKEKLEQTVLNTGRTHLF